MTTGERLKALELAISQIEKRFGKGSIMKLGESTGVAITGIIPTGSISMDIALGLGGIPKGRITEIFGPGTPLDEISNFIKTNLRERSQ